MARKPIYEDDKMINKTFRCSQKYEYKYIKTFIKILRKFRQKAIDFISSFEKEV